AVVDAQRMVLNALLDVSRMQRMIETEVLDPGSAYRLRELFADLERAVWTELPSGAPIDAYRRALQRAHIERLVYLVVDDPAAPAPARAQVQAAARSDARALARAQLRELRDEAARAARRTRDDMTRIHLEDVAARIDAALAPNR